MVPANSVVLDAPLGGGEGGIDYEQERENERRRSGNVNTGCSLTFACIPLLSSSSSPPPLVGRRM